MNEETKELVDRLAELEVKAKFLDTLVSTILGGLEKGYSKGEYRIYNDTEICALLKVINPAGYMLRVNELEHIETKGDT